MSAIWVFGSRLLRPDDKPAARLHSRPASAPDDEVVDDNGFVNSVCVYMHKGRAYLPKSARIRNGASVQIEPVLTVDLVDHDAFVAAIATQLDQRLILEKPQEDNHHKLLARLPLRSWRQVYRQMGYYTLLRWTDRWTMDTWKKGFNGRGFEGDDTLRLELPGDLTVEEAAQRFHDYIDRAELQRAG